MGLMHGKEGRSARSLVTPLLALAAGLLVVVVALYVSTVLWPREITDVLTYRHAALRLREGGVGLYDVGRLPEGVWPYLYPPAFAALVAPILLLPEAVGNLVWALVVAGSVLASFWTLRRLAGLGDGPTALLALTLAPATVWLLVMGQVDALVVALLALGLLALARERDGWAGALIGVAAAIKVIPVLALVPLLVLGRWRVAGTAVTAAAALSLLPLPWLVADAGVTTGVAHLVGLHVEFVRDVVLMGVGHPTAEEWLRLPWNASLPATSLRLTGIATPGSLLMWALVVGGGWIARRTRDAPLGVALVVTGAALGSFVFSTHNVFLFALPLALAFNLVGAGLVVAGLALVEWVGPVPGAIAYAAAWVTCAWKGSSSSRLLLLFPTQGAGPRTPAHPTSR